MAGGALAQGAISFLNNGSSASFRSAVVRSGAPAAQLQSR